MEERHVTDPDDKVRELQAKYGALALAATRLVVTLPKCTYCIRPATRAWKRGEARFCDGCGPDVPEYPRAQPLRDMIEALKALGI